MSGMEERIQDAARQYLQDGKLLCHDCDEISELGTSVSYGVANRVLHPGVRDQNPQGRESGCPGNKPDDRRMRSLGEFLPSKDPDSDKSGLEKEGSGRFYCQERPEHVTDKR